MRKFVNKYQENTVYCKFLLLVSGKYRIIIHHWDPDSQLWSKQRTSSRQVSNQQRVCIFQIMQKIMKNQLT